MTWGEEEEELIHGRQQEMVLEHQIQALDEGKKSAPPVMVASTSGG